MEDSVWEIDFLRKGSSEDIGDIILDLDKISSTYGQHNPEALIGITEINFTPADVAVMGKKSDTVKITKNGVGYMFFRQTQEQIDSLLEFPEAQLTIVGSMNVNEFRGNRTPQVFVKDYEVVDASLLF